VIDVSKLTDISNAETYADALERAQEAEISYNPKRPFGRVGRALWNPFSYMLLFVFYAIYGTAFKVTVLSMPMIFGSRYGLLFYYGYSPAWGVFLYLAILATVWFTFLILPLVLLFGFRVRLKNGKIRTRKPWSYFRSMRLENALWIYFKGKKHFVFGKRGRKIRLPRSESVAQTCILHLLFTLGKMSIREEAGSIRQSRNPKIELPLTEGVVWRLVPYLFLRLLVVSILVLIGIAAVIDDEIAVGSLLFLLPAGILLVYMIRRTILFILAYRFAWEIFTPAGLLLRKRREIPYEKMRITLYRGSGKIDDPEPGIIDVSLPGEKKLYFGQGRLNFFLLPYLLEEWAGESFRILPIGSAPRRLRRAQYRDDIGLLIRKVPVM
jgi:hypothetical protein